MFGGPVSSLSEFWHLIHFNDLSLENDWARVCCLVSTEHIDSVLDHLGHGHLVAVQEASNGVLFGSALGVHLRQTHSAHCARLNLGVAVEQGSIGLHKLLEDWLGAKQLTNFSISRLSVLH